MQRRIIFKDSLNFFAGPLSSLYDTFDLKDSPGIEKKPHFPHYFNTQENLHLELHHLPAIEFYGINEMKAVERAAFLEFYAANRKQKFNLSSALIEYCTNDVRLLRLIFYFLTAFHKEKFLNYFPFLNEFI